ncbi:MAG: hypothetical protein Q7J35_03195 [Candidatus Methanoperedens sp.]|nr:hypothetical protein [Candidatus Methanoperedens sp.]
MYKIGQNVETIQKEIDIKLKKGQNYEALIYSVFSFERMVRRTIKVMLIRAGYHPKFIDGYIIGEHSEWSDLRGLFKMGNLYLRGSNEGINDILTKPIWKNFDNNDPMGAMQIRNKIAHGIVPEEEIVQLASQNMKKVIEKWDLWTSANLKYNGTQRMIYKKSTIKIPYPEQKK